MVNCEVYEYSYEQNEVNNACDKERFIAVTCMDLPFLDWGSGGLA